MMIASPSNLIALHGQHTLQRDALLSIYRLANAEGISESLESWSFDEFLGFTFHLFITTKSPEVREQLSQLLPKFGSEAVRPLVKIVNHFQPPSELRKLALQSLKKIAPYPLVIGLGQILENEADDCLRGIVIPLLVNLMREEDKSVFWLLLQLLSEENQQLLAIKSLEELSEPDTQAGSIDDEIPLQLSVIADRNAQSCRPAKDSRNVRPLSLCRSK
ncbi:MAG: hypothetical protein AAF329_11010 [Cyanobacteria bacterium P01_A01_bin.17]